MLPLWIIDLTESADRRARLEELLRQTGYVFFSKDGDSEDDVCHDDYRWLYTHYEMDGDPIPDDLSSHLIQNIPLEQEIETYGDRVYSFQNRLVRDGQLFVRMIRHSSMHAYTTLNICVLGDATEYLTQLIFPSVALLIQKEKGRMLANHIHQGMSVIGAMFVPSAINSKEVTNRENALRTLREVDVQKKASSVRGYDHVLLYQDVQNRVDKYYPLLDCDGQAEYLYQCLVHLYYACNTQHPLISGVAAADSFYLSMGAASVFFDTSYQDTIVSCELSNKLIDAFYAVPQNDDIVDTLLGEKRQKEKKEFINPKTIGVESILSSYRPEPITIDANMPDPYPDPTINPFEKYLKRRYYGDYLKVWVAEFRRRVNDQVEKSTSSVLELLHVKFNHVFSVHQDVSFPERIGRFLEDCNSNDGGLSLLESRLKGFKDTLGEQKKRIPDYVENKLWESVYSLVPKKYIDAFHSYHNAYRQDISSKKKGNFSDEMKNAAIDDLCNHLKQESTLMSRLVRALLLGVLCVLVVVPALSFISPMFVNLGTLKHSAWIWAFASFIIPFLCELYSGIRYAIKRQRKFNKLEAYYLHDAYARIANRILSESASYYDKLVQLCDCYLKRTEKIRKEIYNFSIPEKGRGLIPSTRFNQPLVEGDFCGHSILTKEAMEPKLIYIDHVRKPVETLVPDDYFALVHLFKSDFKKLFDGVCVPDEHPYEINKEDGSLRILSPEEVKRRATERWQKVRDTFKNNLPMLIKEELVELVYPSACEMLMQHFEKTGDGMFIKPFIQYAATNGEFITSANLEQIDVKTLNSRISQVCDRYFPSETVYQIEQGGVDNPDFEVAESARLFEKFIFLTRWCAFDEIALNRILPLEDFDLDEKKRQVNEEDRKGLKASFKAKKAEETDIEAKPEDYPISSSSTILWSLCEGDNSVIWLDLFNSLVLKKARQFSDIFKNKLTTKD